MGNCILHNDSGEISLVDFQMSGVGPAVHEVLYFLLFYDLEGLLLADAHVDDAGGSDGGGRGDGSGRGNGTPPTTLDAILGAYHEALTSCADPPQYSLRELRNDFALGL